MKITRAVMNYRLQGPSRPFQKYEGGDSVRRDCIGFGIDKKGSTLDHDAESERSGVCGVEVLRRHDETMKGVSV